MRSLPLLKRRTRRLPTRNAPKIKTHSRVFAGKTGRPFAITSPKRKIVRTLALFFLRSDPDDFGGFLIRRCAFFFKSDAAGWQHTPSRSALLPGQYARPARLCAQLRLRAYAAPRSYAPQTGSPAAKPDCAHTLRFHSVRLHASDTTLQRFFRVRRKCNVLIILSV